MQRISKSSIIAAEEPMHYMCITNTWHLLGFLQLETHPEVYWRGKKREKHIRNLKRVHFYNFLFWFGFQNVFPFFPLTSQTTSSVKWPYKFIYFMCNH